MNDAGQIFALLRSASAAELAKRFNSFADGGIPAPTGIGPVEADALPTPAGGAGAAQPGKVVPTPATAPLAGTSLPGQEPGGPGHEAPDLPSPQTVPLRSAIALGHLAPPRAELARQLADSLISGLPRGAAQAFPGTGVLAGGGLPGLGAGDRGQGYDTGGFGLASGGSTLGDTTSATGRPLSAAPGLLPGGAAALAGGQAADTATRTVLGGTQAAKDTGDSAKATLSAAIADLAQALGEARGGAARGATPTQVAVFAEALTAMLRNVEAGPVASVASGVIFNAAMIPGWPFASAMARDGGHGVNPKAMLHQLAAAVEGMTPQQAAEYMAKIGGGHILLRKLRQLLKELDLIEKDEVKGLLFAFLETLSTIALGIQTALRQLTESAALQSAVIHGEDPDDDDRPGRRRLRL